MDFIKNISIDKVRNAAEDVINQARPRNDVEARVYEVLSHKNWGSSSTKMNEIAADTFEYDKYAIISKILWESLQSKRPAAWRVVFKALTLLEHLIKNGSERCVDEARGHSHVLRSLQNFNYYEGTTDRGVGVREKSKQLVEILSDDERIREERQKARELKEKFGGNLGGVGSSGSMGGGGGGRYAGYGNDSSSDRYNGSSGYGDSGIGSSSYGNSGFDSSSGDRYSGRYDTRETTSSAPKIEEEDTPTFAALPEKKKKKKKSSKKKKEKSADDFPVEATPAVDLFDLSDPTPAVGGNDSFDAFQEAGGNTADITKNADGNDSFDAFGEMASATVQKESSFDAFGDMASASVQKQSSADQFDAFGVSAPLPAAPAPSTQQPVFDAFASGNVMPQQQQPTMGLGSGMNDMFGNMSIGNANNGMQQQMMNGVSNMSANNGMQQKMMNGFSNVSANNGMQQQMMNGFSNVSANNGMQQQMMNGVSNISVNNGMQQHNMMNGVSNASVNPNIMGGGKGFQKQQSNTTDGDDFGNFESGGKANKPSDPLSNLISLDGLSKNKKDTDRTNEPIVFNDAAKKYVQNQQNSSQGQGQGNNKIAAELAFSGVDGLNKMPTTLSTQSTTTRQPGKPIMSSGLSMNNSTSMNNGMIGSSSGAMGMMGGSTSSMNSSSGMMGSMQQGGMNTMGGGQGMNMMGSQQGMGGGNNMGGQQGMGGTNMGGQQGMNMMGGQQGMGGMNMGGQGSMGGMNMMGGQGGMGGMNTMGGQAGGGNTAMW